MPSPVLRQWSDALSAAGLFAEALQIYPATERADIVRKAELAVLAGDHKQARQLLAELKAGNTPRTARTAIPVRRKDGKGGRPAPSKVVSPWLELLTRIANLLAGDAAGLAGVVATARKVQQSAGVAWVVALAAATAGDLGQAAPAARKAREGGCRDLRMIGVLAADSAASGDDETALSLVAEALAVALPDEDPAGYVTDLLDRAGFRADAQRLAALGAGDASLPASMRAAWRVSARTVGASRKHVLRRSLAAAGGLAELPRGRAGRRLLRASLSDLTCRCYGSAGWIGPDRLYYVTHHLTQVLPAPVAGLSARLLRCRATGLTFLDLTERQLTLPVVSELARVPRGPAVGGGADGGADTGRAVGEEDAGDRAGGEGAVAGKAVGDKADGDKADGDKTALTKPAEAESESVDPESELTESEPTEPADPESDRESRPTPGMGVSLGVAL